MKRYLFTICAIGLSLLAAQAAEKHERYEGSRIFWDMDTHTNIYPRGGYVRIIELQNGEMLMVCHSHSNQEVVCCRSTDSGKTWGPAQDITHRDPRYSCNNAEIYQLKDGTVIAGYGGRPLHRGEAGCPYYMACKRSLDNGHTWSDEIRIFTDTSAIFDGCWEPAFLELPNGELDCYFSDESIYPLTNEQRLVISRSFDKGLTWSEPETFCFKAGSRDGMPVPIILADGKTIAVTIEDRNALPVTSNIGHFRPAIIRTTIEDNWHSGYVDENSPRRNTCFGEETMHNRYNAAAPYVAKLPSGELVITFQTDYQRLSNKENHQDMGCCVGDPDGRHFKALTRPFHRAENDVCWWNSVMVTRDGRVLAVGSTNWGAACRTGYPMNHFETLSKGASSRATDIIMGWAIDSRWVVTFDASKKGLTLHASVNEASPQPADGIRFYVDAADVSTTTPEAGCYYVSATMDGQTALYVGDNGEWKEKQAKVNAQWTKTMNGYELSITIPWTTMGIKDYTQVPLYVGFERWDVDLNGVQIDRIPDVDPNQPWTYVPLTK